MDTFKSKEFSDMELDYIAENLLLKLKSLETLDIEHEEDKLLTELVKNILEVTDDETMDKLLNPITAYTKGIKDINFLIGMRFINKLLMYLK